MRPEAIDQLSPLDGAQERVEDLATRIVYSMLTSLKIQSLVFDDPGTKTLGDLKEKNTELYRIVLASIKQDIRENPYVS